MTKPELSRRLGQNEGRVFQRPSNALSLANVVATRRQRHKSIAPARRETSGRAGMVTLGAGASIACVGVRARRISRRFPPPNNGYLELPDRTTRSTSFGYASPLRCGARFVLVSVGVAGMHARQPPLLSNGGLAGSPHAHRTLAPQPVRPIRCLSDPTGTRCPCPSLCASVEPVREHLGESGRRTHHRGVQ